MGDVEVTRTLVEERDQSLPILKANNVWVFCESSNGLRQNVHVSEFWNLLNEKKTGSRAYVVN